MIESGVYKITNIENGKVYIGSSKNINRRIIMHLSLLNRNTHFNPHLQSAWNKYGEENFEFSVLEFVSDVNVLLEREQFWIDKTLCYKRNYGYNILPVAGSSKGTVTSEETKQKISKSLIGRQGYWKGKKLSESHRNKMKESHTKPRSKNWIVIDSMGNKFNIHNLEKFCRENNLSSGHMVSVSKGKRKQHKGWKCEKDNSMEE